MTPCDMMRLMEDRYELHDVLSVCYYDSTGGVAEDISVLGRSEEWSEVWVVINGLEWFARWVVATYGYDREWSSVVPRNINARKIYGTCTLAFTITGLLTYSSIVFYPATTHHVRFIPPSQEPHPPFDLPIVNRCLRKGNWADMRIGETRVLPVHPSEGYPEGCPSIGIPPDTHVIFIIELTYVVQWGPLPYCL
eukprot:TRINITY_DN20947_c0_g1_i1.p1 TRINITY_DN20947_c0_g1~~TRINITY_DN20947_c0_g1_i1.p1  ORF type:complete len:194 (+),score=6.37 TRINITY_DN20947_c0_g1_i1:106-687(+)